MNPASKKHPLPVHSFLISLYPALALLAYNIKEIEPRAAYRALLVSFLLVVVVFLGSWAVTRSGVRAALVASLFAALFFTYGHVNSAFREVPLLKFILGKQSVLAVLYLLLFVAGFYGITRKLKNTAEVTSGLSLVSAVLFILPIVQIVISLVGFSRSAAQIDQKVPIQKELQVQAGQTMPDVYFIILDTYASQNFLLNELQFDNSAFIQELEALGFVVPRCSQSNYVQTELSLSSTLNLDYLPVIDPRYVSGYQDRSELPALIKQSLVRRSLDQIGYKTVAFGTGYSWSEIRDADVFYYPGDNGLSWLRNQAGLNQFEAMYLRTTAGLLLTTLQFSAMDDLNRVVDNPYQDHINIQLFDLDAISNVPSISGPKFVFMHLLIPHGPFVFGPDGVLPVDEAVGAKESDGGDLTRASFVEGFIPQIQYINNRMLPILEGIIQNSKTPPIIIVQGDHGPFSNPSILNAYYLPGNKDIGLYPTITPVNSFRLIFNAYFDTNFELLPDVSYSSTDADPFGGDIFPNPCLSSP
ncbi:MAG: hypothetical protein JW987_14940 [Anaerolineaceae bacterium]|nr:hypothetical protein [Anaerolineaceae bacterium]